MRLLDAGRSTLLLIDFQDRLMPAITGGPAAVAAAVTLVRAARLLGVPILATEQYPQGLGATVAPLAGLADRTIVKRAFDAMADPDLTAALDPARPEIVVAGCEAHVCVLQTVSGLLARGHAVSVVADAVGSRTPASRDAALARMAQAGVAIVTLEMVLFEWVARSDHPRFREVLALVK